MNTLIKFLFIRDIPINGCIVVEIGVSILEKWLANVQ